MQTVTETLIIATIGPASGDKETLKEMIKAGMDMARLNMSWGTYDKHTEYINNIRDAARELNTEIPIVMDLSGPRVTYEGGHRVDDNVVEIITEKDKKDLVFGASQGIHFFAMSFVKDVNDVKKLRDIIKKLNSDARVIAKIERVEAVNNSKDIITESDMVMIARGDLGREYPLGEIPFIEKHLLEKAKELETPIIVATEILLSMTSKDEPSRAEVTDEVFAIINGADAIMLSEETALGKYPVESIKAMEDIASRTENYHKNEYESQSI